MYGLQGPLHGLDKQAGMLPIQWLYDATKGLSEALSGAPDANTTVDGLFLYISGDVAGTISLCMYKY